MRRRPIVLSRTYDAASDVDRNEVTVRWSKLKQQKSVPTKPTTSYMIYHIVSPRLSRSEKGKVTRTISVEYIRIHTPSSGVEPPQNRLFYK